MGKWLRRWGLQPREPKIPGQKGRLSRMKARLQPVGPRFSGACSQFTGLASLRYRKPPLGRHV